MSAMSSRAPRSDPQQKLIVIRRPDAKRSRSFWHFTEEKLVSFKNFASQAAFVLWQTGHKEFQPTSPVTAH